MSNDFVDLSKYRLAKAKEDLANSKANLRDNYLKGAINRSYYAIFHGIRAVLALDGFDSKKHSGIIAYFNQFYIKAGKFDFDISVIIQKAFKTRNKSDYDDFYVVSREEVEEQIKNAEFLLNTVEKYLKNNL